MLKQQATEISKTRSSKVTSSWGRTPATGSYKLTPPLPWGTNLHRAFDLHYGTATSVIWGISGGSMRLSYILEKWSSLSLIAYPATKR